MEALERARAEEAAHAPPPIEMDELAPITAADLVQSRDAPSEATARRASHASGPDQAPFSGTVRTVHIFLNESNGERWTEFEKSNAIAKVQIAQQDIREYAASLNPPVELSFPELEGRPSYSQEAVVSRLLVPTTNNPAVEIGSAALEALAGAYGVDGNGNQSTSDELTAAVLAAEPDVDHVLLLFHAERSGESFAVRPAPNIHGVELFGRVAVLYYESILGLNTRVRTYAHEMMHLFGACDEYAVPGRRACDCGPCFHGEYNGNCSICIDERVPCLMDTCEPFCRPHGRPDVNMDVCQWTRRAVGWETCPADTCDSDLEPAASCSSCSPGQSCQGTACAPTPTSPRLSLSASSASAGTSVLATCDLGTEGATHLVAINVQRAGSAAAGLNQAADSGGIVTWDIPTHADWIPSVEVRCRDISASTASDPATLTITPATPTLSGPASATAGSPASFSCNLGSSTAGRRAAFFVTQASASPLATGIGIADAAGVARWTRPSVPTSWSPSVSVRCRDEDLPESSRVWSNWMTMAVTISACVPSGTCDARECGTCWNGCNTVELGSCGSPPPDSCSGDARVRYSGTCSASGTCSYNPVSTPCPYGETCDPATVRCVSDCVGGCGVAECGYDACGNICGYCTEPRASDCPDPFTRRSYSVVGTCVGDRCSYAETRTHCGYGCAGGVCGGCPAESCESLGKECGTWNNGCGGNLFCGVCPFGRSCTGEGECCTPQTCADLGNPCGRVSVGIVSDQPTFRIGVKGGGVPVALVGRAEVKVLGEVRPGDFLVASGTQGVAMRAGDPSRGGIVGTAMTGATNGGRVVAFVHVQPAPVGSSDDQELRAEVRELRKLVERLERSRLAVR